ncbi:MAG: tyrosine-type recombinase/integrase [Marinisporobacter sp.]|nr:tyrosine-type recombinase/integrase [Marinisporobacter sp.]
MANIKTKVLTDEEFCLIIKTISIGLTTEDGKQIKPNNRIATALTLQANLGLRIGDIVNLRLSDIIRSGNRYELNIQEQKTGKIRDFTVPAEIYTYLQTYALENSIKPNQRLFSITVRQIQKHLKSVTEYLGLEKISTHSFRKYFAISIYNDNNYNVELVRQLLQHSTVAVTQHYLSVQPREVEQALQRHIKLPS